MTTTGVEHSMTPRAQSILGKCILVLGFFPFSSPFRGLRLNRNSRRIPALAQIFGWESSKVHGQWLALRRWRLATAERSR
jgi:hypothetical protein